MKKLLLSLGAFAIAAAAHAQTSIPAGNVTGTWALAGSPYNIQGSIIIPDGDSLIIEPGVDVIFQGTYKLLVLGKIKAIGNTSDSITFTAQNTTNGWLGIRFDNTNSTNDISKLIYCNIQYGKATGANSVGGAFFFVSFSKAVISHCRISNNNADDYGGGIYCGDNSNPIITENIIANNSAYSGGGIYCNNGSNPVIRGNTISNNTASGSYGYGGGIFCTSFCNPTITNNTITNNNATGSFGKGGGIYCTSYSNPNLINNAISNNRASNGGALYCAQTSTPVFKNTIVYGNEATISGTQVFLEDESSDPSFFYCNIQYGSNNFETNGNFYTGAYVGNIDTTPDFVSPSSGSGTGFDGVSADWSLQNGSPCIDAGDPAYNPYSETDKAGNPRVSGCRTDMGAYEFQESFTFVTSISKIKEVCSSGDGAALVTASGLSTYTYNWNNGSTATLVTNLDAGVNTVTIIGNPYYCIHVESITLDNPPPVMAFYYSVVDVPCFGDSTGSIWLTTTGGAPNYTYIWSNGATVNSLNYIPSGIYSVTVTDTRGCSDSIITMVTQPSSPIKIDTVINADALCYGTTGWATVNVSGGVWPYNYNWSNGNTTQTALLVAGVYKVTATDNNGCNASADSIIINQPQQISVIEDTIINPSCFGYNDGSIDINVSGGTSPYSYFWSNGASTEDIDSIFADSYMLGVTDGNNCSHSDTIYLSGPEQISSTTGNTPVSCKNGNNGALDLNVISGFAPFTFNWSTGSSSEDISGLIAGDYTVTITDVTNCFNSLSYTVTEPPLLVISTFSYIQPTCYGYCNGSAVVNSQGGNGSYSYQWDDFGAQTSSSPSGLCSQTYSVTVTDSKSCSVSGSVAIPQPSILQANISKTNVSCFGGGNGTATVTPSGGTSPYNNLWSTGENTASIANLFPGTYSVNVFDVKGCIANNSVTISQPPPMALALSSTNNTCNGGTTGTATANPSGGTSPYTYYWSTGAGTQNIVSLPAGILYITVTDSCGISKTDSVIISQPDVLSSSITKTDVTCFGNNNGTATANPIGGTSPFSYNWSTGVQTQGIAPLQPATYFVTISDGCAATKTDSVSITEPALFVATNITKTNVSCYGGGNGTAAVTPSGGTTPYIYNWSNGQTGQTAIGLFPGTYGINVFDAKGCLASNSITITQTAPLSAAFSVAYVSCNAGSDGAINLTVNGGTSPYSFIWSNSATTKDISGLIAGIYSVTISDSCGATVTQTSQITQPGVLSILIVSEDVKCNGAANGTANVSASGGVLPYTYLWSNGVSTNALQGVSTGIYTVTVSDYCSASAIDSVIISQPQPLTTSVSKADVTCYGLGNGNATVMPSGGAPPYTYAWNNGQQNSTAIGLFAGNYAVNVFDNNGCLASNVITITQPSSLSVTITGTAATCGFSDGSTAAFASGGTPPYAYLWSGGQTVAIVNGLANGLWSVTVTDGNTCSDDESVTIGVEALPVPICIVTVDSTSTRNIVVWDKPFSGNIDSIRIYREVGLTYQLVGDVSNSVLSEFIDNTSGINPQITSYRYKTAVIDTCGNVSALSPLHKTVHLTSNLGINDEVNLIWDKYEGFTFSYYYILRDTTGSGNFTVIDSVSSGNYTYTDWSPVTTNRQYVISIVPPSLCTASKMLKSYNASKSNTASLSVPQALAVNVTAKDITCYGYADGVATAGVSGGVTPLAYQWNDASNQTAMAATGLSAGTYGVTVTDGAGGTVTGSATVTEPPLLSISGVVDSASSGNNDGAVTVTVSGGTPPYTYLWNNGATTKDLTGLPPGFYFLTVKDKNGCSNMNSFYVPQAIGIEEKNVENPDILVFPNPTTGKLTVLIALPPGSETSSIEIINVLGQTVRYYTVPKSSGNRLKYETDLTGQPEGLYRMQIHADTGIIGRNIIIE